MDPYTQNTQIEELSRFDLVEQLENDPYLRDDDEDGYDDASFNESLNSGHDF
jgi:hypothetical protein